VSHSSYRKTPSYVGLRPATPAATRVGRANRGRDTAPERLLRSALWRRGLRFRVHYALLPGKPDIALVGRKVAIFCDGDFWHGRDWAARREKLARGSNPGYWIAKIERNLQRDREVDLVLCELGWTVLRVWESEVRADPDAVAERLLVMISSPPDVAE
jgi:DNA mismatch endonuclease (patch repair protein)